MSGIHPQEHLYGRYGMGERIDQLEGHTTAYRARIAALEDALRTIADQRWPEGTKAYRFAAFALWGVQCYWCKGFNHSRAWTVGCQCKEGEAWEGWEG